MQYDRNKYLEYINNSAEWKLKKAEVFSFKGKSCERCGSKKRIHVHHGTYERLFNEELTDLFVLCKPCHNKYHSENGKVSLQSTSNFIDRISTYKTNQKKKKEYVANKHCFEKVNFCKDCGVKLKQHKTETHKANPKKPISPFYYKCMQCRKVYFPKFIKKTKKQNSKQIKKAIHGVSVRNKYRVSCLPIHSNNCG
jgi:hypothetical protein